MSMSDISLNNIMLDNFDKSFELLINKVSKLTEMSRMEFTVSIEASNLLLPKQK